VNGEVLTSETTGDCHDAFDKEEPTPPLNTAGTVESGDDRPGHDAPEGGSDAAGGIEDAESFACKLARMVSRWILRSTQYRISLAHFPLRVPASQDKESAGKKSRFDSSEEETTGKKSGSVLGLRHPDDDAAPDPDN
jgi:hypothetical protein